MSDTASPVEKKESGLSPASLLLLCAGLAAGFLLGWFASGMAQPAPVSQLAPVPTDIASAAPAGPVTESVSRVALPVAFNVESRIGTLPWENETDYLSYMEANTGEAEDMLKARYALATRFIGTRELQGNAVEAFLRTPREHFVRERNLSRAYEDTWMPIGYGATITDPDVVSMMTTSLDIKPGHRVLEIGTGSGYQSAIISNMTNQVYSIEIIAPLSKETDELYTSLTPKYPQYANIHRKMGDGYYGWEEHAPFDRIIVTCAIDHLPPPLLRQLAPEGIMVVPLGPPGRQHIMEVSKTKDADGNDVLKRRDVYNGLQVKFIPFRDESGTSYSGKAGE